MNDVVEALRRMKKNLGMYERSGSRGRPSSVTDMLDDRLPDFRRWAEESGVNQMPEITTLAIRIRRLPWNLASFPDLQKLNERLAEGGMSIRAALCFPSGLLDLAGISGDLITVSDDIPVETISLILKKSGHWPEGDGGSRSRGMPAEDVVPAMAQALERAGGSCRFIVDGPGELSRVSDRIETVRKTLYFGGASFGEPPSSELLHELQQPAPRKTRRLSDAEMMTAFGEDPASLTGDTGKQDAASIRKLAITLEKVGMDIRIAIPDPAFGWVVVGNLNRASTFSRLAGTLSVDYRSKVDRALADPAKFGLREIRNAFLGAGSKIRFVLCGPEKGREEVFDSGSIASERTLRIISRRDWEKRKAAEEEISEGAGEPEVEDPEEMLFDGEPAAEQVDEEPNP